MTTWWPRWPPRPTWRTPIPSRAASSSSPCWSSPAPAPAAPRPPMPAWSPRSAATVCIFPTPPAVPPSGAARLPPLPTPSTRRARVPPGPTPCSRITPSTALACTWARRPSAAAWPTRPAPCWPWSGALQPLRRLPRSGWIPWRTARPTPRPPRPTSPLWRTACARWTSCWPAPSPRSRRLAKSCRPRVRSSASVTPASWPLRFSRRRSIWLRSPCGSSAATAGLTTSATAAWITSSPPARTSTSSSSIPRSIPTPADRPPSPPISARWPSLPPPARTSPRRALRRSPCSTATSTWPRWPWAPTPTRL
ncbi:Uncharacterised protein [Flavonifractor plautii]|uniref:Uncharacterized protein n=1 Tax=Flavonifractor plautii TaxID=292800 RepID=A0A174B8M9_FLAPL|nr:Uncharacterised protein [Flavonifractor plautii]